MIDHYELQKWDKIKEQRFLMSDALSRLDDGLTLDRLEIGEWDYACMQLHRVKLYLLALEEAVQAVRNRRMRNKIG